MTSPREQIEADLKEAMKAREKERTETLRMLLSEIKNREIQDGEPVDEKAFTALIKKAVKQRKEAAEQFHNGGRTELAEKEERELVLLEPYLPQQVDEATLRAAVQAVIGEKGLSGPSGMGQVMQAVMAQFGGGADGKLVNQIARELLG